MEMKKFNYMVVIDILRGSGCPKRHLDALLAKTISTVYKVGLMSLSNYRWQHCFHGLSC